MPHALTIHPDSKCAAVARIDVAATRQGNSLRLTFAVYGDIAALSMPARATAERRDRLWQHTCCEVFIRAAAADQAYYELNFSPSTQWAAYRFESYRENMQQAELAAPSVKFTAAAERFELQAMIDCRQLARPVDVWRVGLSAVIEERNGSLSYWALKHPSGKPDFHHADGFIVELEP